MKRILEGELIIMRKDKSGKLCVTDRETYVKMGQEHVRKDREVGRKEIRECEKIVNGHTSIWIKMYGHGKNHRHQQRMRDSKIVRSNNLANLYLQMKDHKSGQKSRGIVSGWDSYTSGLSNMISELLESVANGVINPYEVISSEDMLAKVQECNKMLELLRMRLEAKKKREEDGQEWEIEDEVCEEDLDLYLIGSDVISMFPSLTEVNTGLIIRRQVKKSPVKFDGINFKEMAKYIRIEKDKCF